MGSGYLKKKVTEDLLDQDVEISNPVKSNYHNDLFIVVDGNGRASETTDSRAEFPKNGARIEYYDDDDDALVGVTFHANFMSPAAIQGLYNVLRKVLEYYHTVMFYTEGDQYGYQGAIGFEKDHEKALNYLRALYKKASDMDRMKSMRMQQESRKR